MIPTEPCDACKGTGNLLVDSDSGEPVIAKCRTCFGSGKVDNDRRECQYAAFRSLVARSIETMSEDQATYYLKTIRRHRQERNQALTMLESINDAVKATANAMAKLIWENHDMRVVIHKLERQRETDHALIHKQRALIEMADPSKGLAN